MTAAVAEPKGAFTLGCRARQVLEAVAAGHEVVVRGNTCSWYEPRGDGRRVRMTVHGAVVRRLYSAQVRHDLDVVRCERCYGKWWRLSLGPDGVERLGAAS